MIKSYGVANKDMIGTWSIEIKLSVTLDNTVLEKTYEIQLQIYESDLKDQSQ